MPAYKRYEDRSPAFPLRDLRGSLAVNVSNLNLTKSAGYAHLAKLQKTKGAAALASWATQCTLAS